MNHRVVVTYRMLIVFGCLTALCLTAICYWPSLSGPFLFDDAPNLSPIGEFGGIHSFADFLGYILSGNAGPLGRPVSLASFVLNSREWPAPAYGFKLVNLLIHLVNGLLVFTLALRLLASQYSGKQASQMALLAMTFWLLHPLLVSTTAFVVQRMTQLSCLFVLLGLIGYLHGRSQLATTSRKGWFWILSSLSIGGSLAILSKESGVLLPLFALCIEASIFSQDNAIYRRRLLLLLGLPTLLLAGYLGMILLNAEIHYYGRDFTASERLLTEPRVVLDYLSRTVAPRMQGAGLYHDDFPRSQSFFSPPSTAFSIITLGLLLLSGWLMRRKSPVLALGVFWFFAGHSLESSIIPLELYYEHRNYLPIIGLAIAGSSLVLSAPQALRKVAPVLALFFIAIEAFITWQNAVMWGDQERLVHITVQEHPTSLRALERAALYYAANQDYQRTLTYLEQAVAHHPDKNAIRLSVAQTQCLLGELSTEDMNVVFARIAAGQFEKETILYLPEFIRLAEKQACNALNFASVHQLLDAIEAQEKLPGPGANRFNTQYHRGMLLAAEGRHQEALAAMNAANAIRPDFDLLLMQTVWMITVKNYELAQAYLDKAKTLNQQRSLWAIDRNADINGFQSLIDKGDDNPEYIPFKYPMKLKAGE